MAFDPDEFLTRTAPQAPPLDFDPDAFLKRMDGGEPTPKTEPVPLPQPRPKSAGEEPVPPVPGALPSEVPLPQRRPVEAFPPVQEMTDVPFRATMRGKEVDPTTGEVKEAAGLTGMYTGAEAYANRQANIAAAQDRVAKAERRLSEMKERQQELTTSGRDKVTLAAMKSEVENADKALTDARNAVSAAEREAPEREYPSRVFGAKAAEAVGTIVPSIVGGAARPVDELLDKAGIPRGTGIADYMEDASLRIAGQNISDPAQQDSWAAQFGGGAGSAAGFIAAGAVGKAIQAGATTTSAVAGALQNAEEFYRQAASEDAKARQFGGEGIPAWKKALAYLIGGGLGATEGLGLGGVAGKIGAPGGVKQVGKTIGKEILEEGGQEFGQGVGGNVANLGLYGKDPGEFGVFTGTMKPTVVGAALGGGVGTAVNAPNLFRTGVEGRVPIPEQVPATPEDITGSGIPTAPAAPDPGSATTPIPTMTPVTTITDGVATTTTLHGPADAYMLDTTGDKPVLVPAPTAQPGTTELDVGTKSTVLADGTVVEGPAISQPAIRKFGEEDPSTPVMGFYSRLKSWVEEKGPLNATAARWISQLKRGDFRAEELRDLRLPQFLAQATGRVSKDEMVEYITAMAAPMVEVTRTPLTPEMRKVEEARITAQMIAIARANPEAKNLAGEVNLGHPLIAPLAEELANINRNVKWARYQQYTTVGPMESYTELTLHLPPRATRPVSRPTGEVIYDPAGDHKYPYRVMLDGVEINRTRNESVARSELDEEIESEYEKRQVRIKAQTNWVGQHYVTPNEIVTIRLTVRLDANGRRIVVIEEIQSDLHQKGAKAGYMTEAERGQASHNVKPPADIPFREGWAQLGFTRAIMWAASQGITDIAWTSGEEQAQRYPGNTRETEAAIAQRIKGLQTFYNRTVTGFAKKWARRLGGTVMYTTIPNDPPYVIKVVDRGPVYGPVYQVHDPMMTGWPIRTFLMQEQAEEFIIANTPNETRFRVLRLPGSALETISQGLPTHAMSVPSVPMSGPGAVYESKQHASGPTVTAMQPLVTALNSLIKKLGLETKVTLQLFDNTITYKETDEHGKVVTRAWPNTFGLASHWVDPVNGKFTRAIIRINVGMHKDAAHVWATMTHELGHVIMESVYENASSAVKAAVDAAYQAYKTKVTPTTPYAAVVDAYASIVGSSYLTGPRSGIEFGKMSQEQQDYWGSFNEFFAEMVATWATTRSRPLSLVDKFFAGLAKQITQLLLTSKKMFGLPYTGIPELNTFLDSFVEATNEKWGFDVSMANVQDGTVKNGGEMSPEDTPAPPQVDTGGVTKIVNTVFNGRPPKEVQVALAYADKFNWLYKWALAIHHVAMKNPHIKALQQYVETIRHANHIKQQMMTKTEDILKLWNRLGETQSDAVAALLDDLQNMNYRTPAEVKAHVSRHPTTAELTALAQKHGVSKAGIAVAKQVSDSFQDFLKLYEKVLIDEANKISDQTRQQLKLAAIAKQMTVLRSRPYFPSVRFGVYTLTIRDKARKVIHFETFESKGDRRRAANTIHSRYGVATTDMQFGLINKEAKPLLGVPTQLLDLMEDKLNLSSIQRDALEQLKFELSPAQSFQHRFQHKKRVAGYSMDFRRAYAHYFFHGANHMMKAQYADRLRALRKMTLDEVRDAPDVTKRRGIEAFMGHHLDNWLDPKPDWAAVSSAAFLWGLAFSPAAAMMNMTQTMHTTYPHLAHYFGDASAVRALTNVGRKFETFYAKGKLDQTYFETKAIFQGIEDGIIKETMAAEIAGIADGNVLSRGYGGNYLQRGWTKFNEAGSFLFEMAEQVNRRLAFRAALQLAQEQPNAKYVKDAVTRHHLTYKQRKDEGWTDAEATAYVVAVDTTLATQFQYGKQFAPRIFQGRKRSIFVFKTFVHSYLVFLTQNPGITTRALLMLAMMGGLMGMPFADDMDDIIKMLAYRLFGKDFEPEKEIRKFILAMCSTNEAGDMWAEFALHGIARKGFGIPWLMDMLGGTVGVDIPMPTFDVSRSVGMGEILPVQVGKMFGPPTQSAEKNIAEQSQRASGAVFGIGFAAYKAMVNTQLNWTDAKRWESMIPRAAASMSKAYRAYSEGGMRSNTGGQVVKYDVRDNQQMAEVIGMSMGLTPYRQNYEWEKRMSKWDAEKTWDIRREGLMRQFGNAVLGKDADEKAHVREAIRSFNRDLPPEARGKAITSDSLEKSVETRARDRALEERGQPRKTSSVPIFRREDELYPRSMRELRRVKPGLTP